MVELEQQLSILEEQHARGTGCMTFRLRHSHQPAQCCSLARILILLARAVGWDGDEDDDDDDDALYVPSRPGEAKHIALLCSATTGKHGLLPGPATRQPISICLVPSAPPLGTPSRSQ